MIAAANTRRRSVSPEDAILADYKPYVPVAKRRAQLLTHLGTKHQAKKVRAEELQRKIANYCKPHKR